MENVPQCSVNILVRTGRQGWRGDTCDTLVTGVCETKVTRVLSHPQQLVVTSSQDQLAVRQRLDICQPIRSIILLIVNQSEHIV